MVTGTPPFNGETDLDILKAVKRGKYSLDSKNIIIKFLK